MKIDSLKQLEQVIKLCRKTGITDIKIDGVELHLGAVTQNRQKTTKVSYNRQNDPILPTITPYTPGGVTEQTAIVSEIADIDSDELTDEQKMFWSAGDEQEQQA